ncbi:MAG TPA: glutathione S-transferase family protein [Kofleriaceae bacterium]|jgi:glutathione S-transferase|nr:glutathione S-transferase family protein [Kofleriaceae bacterium]
MTPIIHGTEFSTYVRSVRMAFEEKGTEYKLNDVSVLKGEQKQAAHLSRNPFGTVPAFEHDGLEVYETSPILRYIDQVWPAPALTPDDPKQRARMNQILSIIDYHGYASIIGQIVVQRLFTALLANGTDENVVKAGIPRARLCLQEFERLKGHHTFLAGDQVSFADLYLVPIIFYLKLTPEGELLAPHKGLTAWWEAMTDRKSVKATAPNLG